MATQQHPLPNRLDAVRVDPKHYNIDYEDDRVRVIRIRYGAGEKSTMHGHPASIAVLLTDANIRFTYPDGRTEDMTGTPGQVMAVPAGDHLPENRGKKPFEAVLVELKG